MVNLQGHSSLMVDAAQRRAPSPPQLLLMREVTHLQKIRTLQDPATSSSSSSSASPSGRKPRTLIGDPHRDAQALAVELSAKHAKTAKPPSSSSRGDGGVRIEKLQRKGSGGSGKKMAAEAGNGARHGNGNGGAAAVKKMASYGGESEEPAATAAVGAMMKVDVRERIKRIESAFEGSAERGDAPAATAAAKRHPSIARDPVGALKKERIIRELKERGRKGATRAPDEVRSDERWQGDAGRREELVRRVITENHGTPSSLSQLLSNPRGRARSALSLLGMAEDHPSDNDDAGESLFHSGEGKLSPAARPGGWTRPPVDGHPEAPLLLQDSLRARDWQQSSDRRNSEAAANLRRRRSAPPPPPAAGFKEAAAPDFAAGSAVDGDELGASELPANGCGMPWDWSRIPRYRGKAFMDLAGLTCALPETAGSPSPAKGPLAEVAAAAAAERAPLPVQSISSLDSDANGLPLIVGEDTLDSDVAGFFIESRLAREIPQKIGAHKKRGSLQDAVTGVPVGAPAGAPEAHHRTLSQKYRPKTFRELVGQPIVAKSLAAAVAKARVAPVYLLMGPRGTGKTSAARIFAAGLICLSPDPVRRPCGICRECGTMSLNRSPDVTEIDAAAHADVASLRTAMGSFAPQAARYKVFIVEGCDLLSADIWNAFLKVLEEPPRDVVFVLITTNADRIPLTATSRCQKFHFSKVKESEIVARLAAIAAKEGLAVEAGALALIAARSDGSLRDAEITLEQLSLLDRPVSLALVQELGGLLPDSKLLDLLDLALSADTVNTVRTMRQVLGSGVEPLALVSQLATLITDILAGSFDVHHRETRKKGFFARNFSTKEEQQRLRQALKILSEAEKQLRATSDRSTWLTAALLQFAPDRSFVPSSTDTSAAQSPVDPENPNPAAAEPHPTPETKPALGRTLKSYVENKRKIAAEGRAPAAAPAEVPPEAAAAENAAALSERKLEEAWAREPPQQAEAPKPAAAGLERPNPPAGSCDFRVFAEPALIELWNRVTQEVKSKNLKHFLQSQGQLVAAGVASDGSAAIVEVEFQHARDKQKAERSWRSICVAFQTVLNTPVELRITLVADLFDEAQLATMDMAGPSAPPRRSKEEEEEELDAAYLGEIQVAPLHSHHRRRSSKARKHHRQVTEILEHELGMHPSSEAPPPAPARSRRGRRHGAARSGSGESSWARTSGEAWDSGLLLAAGGGDPSAAAMAAAKGKKVPLSTMMEEPQSALEDHRNRDARRKPAKPEKVQQLRAGSGRFAASIEHKNLAMESRRRPANEGTLCWREQEPVTHTRKQRIRGLRRVRGKALLLRLVPCAKSSPAEMGAAPSAPPNPGGGHEVT